jgi:phosphomethylpyrimidine synthase
MPISGTGGAGAFPAERTFEVPRFSPIMNLTQLEAAMEYVARGEIVIPANKIHLSRNLRKLTGIGKGLRTKVNANLGTSFDYVNVEEEKQKLLVAVEAGADTVMDLSTGGELRWRYARFLWLAFRYMKRQ